jgi:delta14-sterol reductase
MNTDGASANATFWLALGISAGVIFRYGASSFNFFYERWVGFLTASLLMSIAQAFYVYAMSFRSGALLALGGNSGNWLFDVGVFRIKTRDDAHGCSGSSGAS